MKGQFAMLSLFGTLAVVFLVRAEPKEQVLLRFTPPVGSYRDYAVRVSGEVRTGEGQPLALEAAIPLRLRVEEQQEDGRRAIRLVFRRAAIRLGSASLPWTLTRQGYAVYRDDRNRIAEVRSRCAPMTARTGDFVALFHDLAWSFIMPEDPVGAGDTWSYRIDSEPLLFDPSPGETSDRQVEGDFVGEVRDVRVVAGEAAAELRARTTLRTESAAGTVSLKATMDIVIDCATGWPVRADGRVTLGIQPSSGPRVLFPNLRIEVRRYDREPMPGDDGSAPETEENDNEEAADEAAANHNS